MKSLKKIQNQQGFTLIEILITTGVVATVVLGFMGSATAIQSQQIAAYQRSVALQDANQVVELLRNAATSGTFPGNVTGTTMPTYTNLPSEAITATYVSTSANPLDVTVTVTYSENSLRSTGASIRTLITQRA